jgi:hypothetical protein
MIVDCDRCEVRGTACADCVIGVLLGAPEQAPAESGASRDTPPQAPSGAPIVQLDAPERHALALLADQGLVPRLRLVAGAGRRATDDSHREGSIRDAG